MKNYKILLYLFIACMQLFANETLINKEKAPLSVALPLLKSIDSYAIIIGSGPTHMYAFIDPVCPRSREFVEMIVENKNMQKLYTYHFFFYELKRFNSKGLISQIYTEKEHFNMMKRIMVNKEEVSSLEVISSEVQKEIDDIADVAITLDIYKRPYLFVVKPDKEGI